jgi:hypothetical protein
MLTSFCESRADPREGLMPVTYSSQYREMVLAQVRAGRSVYELAGGCGDAWTTFEVRLTIGGLQTATHVGVGLYTYAPALSTIYRRWARQSVGIPVVNSRPVFHLYQGSYSFGKTKFYDFL